MSLVELEITNLGGKNMSEILAKEGSSEGTWTLTTGADDKGAGCVFVDSLIPDSIGERLSLWCGNTLSRTGTKVSLDLSIAVADRTGDRFITLSKSICLNVVYDQQGLVLVKLRANESILTILEKLQSVPVDKFAEFISGQLDWGRIAAVERLVGKRRLRENSNSYSFELDSPYLFQLIKAEAIQARPGQAAERHNRPVDILPELKRVLRDYTEPDGRLILSRQDGELLARWFPVGVPDPGMKDSRSVPLVSFEGLDFPSDWTVAHCAIRLLQRSPASLSHLVADAMKSASA